jgi:hypothetical protein
MVKTELMGFVRRTKSGKGLRLSISADAFSKAERYTTQDGTEFVPMFINLSRIYQLIEGEKEVTNVTQITN